jgi:hypothetical protein
MLTKLIAAATLQDIDALLGAAMGITPPLSAHERIAYMEDLHRKAEDTAAEPCAGLCGGFAIPGEPFCEDCRKALRTNPSG